MKLIRPLSEQLPNQVTWKGMRSGKFDVRNTYRAVVGEVPEPDDIWKKIWSTKLHFRLQFLLWHIVASTLPIRSRLASIIDIPSSFCVLCGRFDETVSHLFSRCDLARMIWLQSSWGLRTEGVLCDLSTGTSALMTMHW